MWNRGIVATQGVVAPPVLQRMNDLLAHRGPDGEGFLFASGEWGQLRHSFVRRADEVPADLPVRVALGHRRLAILNLSDRGLQPMGTRDGKTWVVFNGEIYNHRELRANLESKGHVFCTQTDTEVLLHAYVEFGEDCVTKLDGMFAFVVWDVAKGRLFCVRDRLGIKPFYYATPSGHFAFGSEIKALLGFPPCERQADDDAAVGFLVHGNCDYSERTLFRGVRALPAARTLSLDVASGRPRICRYWSLDEPSGLAQNHKDLVPQLRETLTNAVRTHLMSDVRVGSCLSGGLDSSTLVALIGRIRRDDPEATTAIGDQLYTFTSCYAAKEFDEREYALEVARSVGAKPHLVFPSPDDFWSDFQWIAWHQDMPFGSLSFYAQWRVMRAAREAGVKVLIDGQGGDEVFGGYAKFRYAYLASCFARGSSDGVTGTDRDAPTRRPYVLDIRKGYRYLPGFVRRTLKVDSVLQRVVAGDWNRARCR